MLDGEITTVDEWNATEQAWQLIDAVHRDHHLRRTYRKSQRRRKLRLYCCAMARTLWSRLEPHEREAVEAAERFADNVDFDEKARRATERERQASVFREFFVFDFELREHYASHRLQRLVGNCLVPNGRLQEASHFALWETPYAVCQPKWVEPPSYPQTEWRECIDTVRQSAADVVREVFRNPFLPSASSVVFGEETRRWARSIYEERRFDELPILGDAVEDSGCDDALLLEHLRKPASHVRGCWALDRLLGLE